MRLLAPLLCAMIFVSVVSPLCTASDETPIYDPAALKLGDVNWVLPLGDLSKGARTLWGTIDGNELYALDSNNMLHCIALDRGVHKWVLQVDGKPTFKPTIGIDTIGVCVKDRLILVRRSNGSRFFDKTIEFAPCTAPACSRDVVFAGSLHKERVVSIDTKAGLSGWSFRFRDNVTAAPLLAGSGADFFLYVVANDGSVACLAPAHAAKGGPSAPEWSYKTGDQNTADPVVSEELLLVASRDCSLYAFNRLSGAIKWRYFAGVPLLASPKVVGDKVFQTDGSGIICISRSSGKELWAAKGQCNVIGIVKGVAYVSSEDGTLTLVNATTGKEIRKVKPAGVAMGVTNPDPNSGLLIFTDGSKIYALK